MHRFTAFCLLIIALFSPLLAVADMLPLPAHNMLKMDDGKWSAKLSLFKDGKLTGHHEWQEDNFMLGELWSIGTLYGDYDGKRFEGYATLGYSPQKQKYVGTWIDNVSSEMLHMEGDFDSQSNTLVLYYSVKTANNPDEQRKNIMIYHNSEHRDFTAYALTNGMWLKVMHIDYRRIE